MPERGPNPTNKTSEIRRVLRENERPFMGTGELAKALGYGSNPGVQTHLDRAHEKGELEKAKISGYNIWYLPEVTARPEEPAPAAPAPTSTSQDTKNTTHHDQDRGQTQVGGQTMVELSEFFDMPGVWPGVTSAATFLLLAIFAPYLGFSALSPYMAAAFPLLGFTLGLGVYWTVVFVVSLWLGLWQKYGSK